MPALIVGLSSAALALAKYLTDVPSPNTFAVTTSRAVIHPVRAAVVAVMVRVIHADIAPPIATRKHPTAEVQLAGGG